MALWHRYPFRERVACVLCYAEFVGKPAADYQGPAPDDYWAGVGSETKELFRRAADAAITELNKASP